MERLRKLRNCVSRETVKNAYIVTLGEVEIRYIEAVVDAKIRYDQECRKVINLKSGEKTRRRLLNFTGAELAFAKIFNVYMDFTRRYRYYDVILPNGGKVDIKHTDQDRGHLIAGIEAHKSIADWYALMVGEFPTFEFRGAILGEVFIMEDNIRDLGHGPCYVVGQERLILSVEDWV
jgi:hypothetical protein